MFKVTIILIFLFIILIIELNEIEAQGKNNKGKKIKKDKDSSYKTPIIKGREFFGSLKIFKDPQKFLKTPRNF